MDVIHMHGLDFTEYLPPAGVPALVTLHLPPAWYPPRIFQGEALRRLRPGTWLHCVSASQRRACPPEAELLPEIENGVPVEELQAGGGAGRPAERGYALALGRICPEKNFHAALDAGRRAGIAVLLAGRVFPYEAHERYFREQILPRLDGLRRFLGPVSFPRKRRLLSAARCLLLPSLAPETSSLAAMEALACGTPVVAYPSGALPEIVEQGVTGFLVENEEQMARAIGKAGGLDPEACRRAARRRFALPIMIGKYLDVYRKLADAGRPTPGPRP